MTSVSHTDEIQILCNRATEIGAHALTLPDQLITNLDTDELDQAFEEAVTKLRKAERDISIAIRKQGDQ